jgi:uncharacterized membrane protein YphA (DoxX/SURF4 family)
MTATTTARTTAEAKTSKILHVGLWVAQVLIALAFAMAGTMKVTQPIATLAAKMVWPGAMPEALVRFIGLSELLGALGLVLPAATRIKPILTPAAAIGLTTIMVLAACFHLSRGEAGMVPTNLILGGLAAFVAWGRLKKAPIAPR